MDKEHLIRLTNNLYQLTLLFPKKEPLRYKMREVADEILANFIIVKIHSNPSLKTLDGIDQLLDDLEVLNSFFAIADVQEWVSPSKLLPAWDDYSKIKKHIGELNKKSSSRSLLPINQEKKEISEIVRPEVSVKCINKTKEEPFGKNSSRHEKILEFLKEKGKAQVWEFKTIFPEVTKRTLRRDFNFLLRQGTIERMGEKNNTFYQIKEVGQING